MFYSPLKILYTIMRPLCPRTQSFFLFLSSFLFVFLSGCKRDTPTIGLGLEDLYRVQRMQILRLEPSFTGKEYRWTLRTTSGADSLVSTQKDYSFVAEHPGTYLLSFEVTESQTRYKHTLSVQVEQELISYSPYINKVIEFRPAPGQFVNTMPMYQEGDTEKEMIQKASMSISGKNDVPVSLGGYGGYITFAFDHIVMNGPGNDFLIKGNAFYSDNALNPNKKGGSSEPGIVMVAFDANGNGKPDPEEWYELAGSETGKASTTKNYSITYHKPDPDQKPTPGQNTYITDIHYIRWTDNLGKSGYIERNSFHSQPYYPAWIQEDSYTLQGTLLPPNGVNEGKGDPLFVLYAFDWGYVDNHPIVYPELNCFDINHAIDSKGNSIKLPGVNWIRVYTAVNQCCGWIGETSTEISQAIDLHLQPILAK